MQPKQHKISSKTAGLDKRASPAKCNVGQWRLPFLSLLLLMILVDFHSGIAVSVAKAPKAAGVGIPCYAFMQRGDLWTVCEGKRVQLRLPFRTRGFTVSPDGSHIAYFLEPGRKDGLRERIVVVSLAPGFKTTITATGNTTQSLSSTCGTLLEFQTVPDKSSGGPGLRWSGSATDLITEKPIEYPANELFRCSSDRRVLALWRNAPGNPQSPPQAGPPLGGILTTVRDGKEVARFTSIDPPVQVSPSGQFVLFTQNSWKDGAGMRSKLCVTKIQGETSCLTDFVRYGLEYPLSDAGEVLYLIELDKSCGQKEVCYGIAYWHPGLPKGEIIVNDDSFDPQWITPQIAARLHEWAITFRQAPKTNKN
jgi:hypothetical protein